MTDTLVFDAATHTYTVGGRVVPSVTQLLRRAFPSFSYPSDYHADAGTRIHACTAQIDRGHTDLKPDFDIASSILKYREFKRDHRVRWTMIERLGFHPNLLFAGTVDRIGWLNGTEVVFDLKTGVRSETDGPQLAAYDLLFPLPGGHRRRRVCCYLGCDRYQLITHTNPNDYNTFLRLALAAKNEETTTHA